jgi:two-component system response regulator AlgR
MDGLEVARALGRHAAPPSVIFVTAHEDFAVEAFDLDAIDYVLKPVGRDRLERAVGRVLARRGASTGADGGWLREFWVPHRSELLRIDAAQVERIDAERDYVRLHVGGEGEGRSYLLLQTIAGLEAKLDPEQFIRIHRSTILRRDGIKGLRHEGLGVWSAELADGEALRIGRTYLRKVKGMTGR